MSFWANTDKYNREDENGTTWLNVSGVPGGMERNSAPFCERIERALQESKGAITERVAREAMRAYAPLTCGGDDCMPRTRVGRKEPFFVETRREYQYTSAFYVCRFLRRNVGAQLVSGTAGNFISY